MKSKTLALFVVAFLLVSLVEEADCALVNTRPNGKRSKVKPEYKIITVAHS